MTRRKCQKFRVPRKVRVSEWVRREEEKRKRERERKRGKAQWRLAAVTEQGIHIHHSKRTEPHRKGGG